MLRKNQIQQNKSSKAIFDSASMFFLIVALVLISIGIYLHFRHKNAVGISQPSRYGQGGGKVLSLPGLFVMGLGLFFLTFPIIDLIRYFRSKM
jgi:hypothetical protein